MSKKSEKIEWKEADDLVHRFATAVRCRMNAQNVVVEFGYQTPGSKSVRTVAQISQTPALLKLMATDLAANVNLYEETFGEIVTEPIKKDGAN